ncbi:hypothetical protein A8709_16730 [Paenibacillus pectinilyticus]|uniref:Uncharacterized protein n=2 Tax=Paenibacillus pectinilyticus TaxID=512399 RepID=A0A1C1A8P5_9BACL|nr:hypothetical protein A8709_16730 [Paenibacillus pectinilyticus]
MSTIYRDCDFHNVMLYGQYIMVMIDGRMAGGGLIASYDEKEVLVGSKIFSRSQYTFVVSPPPQCYVEFI